MSAGGYLDGCGFIAASSGTGDFVVSVAVQGYQTPASASAVNGTVYTYRAESADKSQWEIGFGAYTSGTTTLARTTQLATSTGAKVSFLAAPNVYVTAAKADLQNASLLNSGTVPTAVLPTIATSVIGELKLMTTTRVPANFMLANGAAVSRTTFAALFNVLVFSSTVTFTNGSANIGWTNHGMSAGDKVKFFTTGTLPTNFTAGTHGYNVATEYTVIATGLTTNAFQVALTRTGTAIVAGSAGTGTQTAVNAPWGDGDGATTFTLPDYCGDFIRGFDTGQGIDTNRTFGAEQLDAMQGHLHSAGFPSPAAVSASGGGTNTSPGGNTGGPITDGVNGTPRTAAETRPRNMTVLPCIRYQ
jgi:microcystin-dependent protein